MCWKCGNILDPKNVSRNDVCPVCSQDVRSCKNCVFYEPGSHYDCHESIEDPVSDKERANMCDWFKLNQNAKGPSNQNEKSAKAKAAFDALFS